MEQEDGIGPRVGKYHSRQYIKETEGQIRQPGGQTHGVGKATQGGKQAGEKRQGRDENTRGKKVVSMGAFNFDNNQSCTSRRSLKTTGTSPDHSVVDFLIKLWAGEMNLVQGKHQSGGR